MLKSKFKSVLLVVLALALTVALAACGGKDQGTQTQGAEDVLSGTITIAGSTSVQPISEELAQAFMAQNKGVTIHVQGGGSSAGIKAAIEGAAEIGASSRNLKSDEKAQVNEHIICLDGIAVVSNAKNTAVENLTLEQVRQIMSGEIKNWKEVGGPDAKINVVSREEGSGTRGAFTELVMEYKDANGDKKVADLVSDAAIQSSNGSVRATIAGDEYAFGYLSLGYLDSSVNTIKINGVDPTDANIKAGTYEVARPFIYLTKGETSEVTKAFIEFVLGEEGQTIVGSKYIRVN